MNERIKELIEQATTREKGPPVLNGYDSYNSEIILFDKEKFAKLIVRECGAVINSENYREHSKGWNDAIEWADGMIKEHFGVEE